VTRLSSARGARLKLAVLATGALLGMLLAPESSSGSATLRYGGKIVFYSDRTGTFEIYVMRADGTGVRRLTTTKNKRADMGKVRERANFWPRWSPDGKRIVFQAGPPHLTQGEIYVMNADGSGRRRLTGGYAANVFPAWSPDGLAIAYTSARDTAIHLMSATGFQMGAATPPGIRGAFPTWSPDGKRIAFVCNRGSSAGICAVTVLSAVVTTLWKSPGPWSILGIDWSPDGRTLLFDGGPPAAKEPDIYSVSANGRMLRRLTTSPAVDEYPDWSPDGRHIVFSSNRTGLFDLYVMDAAGSHQVRLAKLPGHDDAPDWTSGNQ
jgi:TolB protein